MEKQLWGLKYMKKKLYRTNIWKQKQNKQKLGFLGNGITHARTGLRMHEFNLRAQARSYVHRSLPKKPN